MAFDTIEELLKSKNVTPDPNDPNKPKDPNAPKDPNDPDADDPNAPPPPPPVKPFGDMAVDPLTGNPIFGSNSGGGGLFASLGDQHSGHKAVILKRSFNDGKVKLYQDSKGLAERTEILMENGKVVIYKDYDFNGASSRYKKIEVYSIDDELRGTINLYPRDHNNPRPVYRFFYERTEIGNGNGDIAMFVAQELVGRNIQARSGLGTSIDGEIITTIKQILQNKR